MSPQPWACSQCSRVISLGDTLIFNDGLASHLDCDRPRMLTPEERAILIAYCVNHTVARCLACGGGFHLSQLASDPLGARLNLCPECRRDLTEMVRAHLYGCAMLPEEVRRRAMALREAAQNLVKQSHRLRDSADALLREAEVVLDECRRALWHSVRGTG